ncbi:NAD(P)-binding protein [Plenodomus tracheiphilus IPT5]|uniref:NAD(P)-binding protein n=1 Tax=Plenodomus tracheiphilus IPT5 TaxID=1408161 RepID=A0A6A7AP18_9PLEO|nr:NAD(P)-binding protein [Plenodomus tracheiphilus IPT5]
MVSTEQARQLPLSGKIAIVTGASRGIGAAVTLTYTSSSSQKAVEDAVSVINALGNGAAAIACQADLRDLDSPRKIVLKTTAAFGQSIDILVNNAGVLSLTSIQDLTVEEYNHCVDVNLRAVVFMTKEVLPYLQRPGRIINISSVAARLSVANMPVYSATKAAVEGLTRSLASQLGPQGHTVNVVQPGATKSDMLEKTPEVQEMQKAMTPLEHRLGTPEDVALIVAMVAEPQIRWLTGQSISASGGMLMS